MASPTQLRGNIAENAALHYLQKKRLILVTRNFRCKLGEIDLIMQDTATLVFIEVRCRNHAQYGNGADSITIAKQQKILRAASLYLLQKQRHSTPECRFDVVSVSGLPPAAKITWIKSAFLVE